MVGESIARMSDSVKPFFERTMRQVIDWVTCYENRPAIRRKKPHRRHNRNLIGSARFMAPQLSRARTGWRGARAGALVQRRQPRSRVAKLGIQLQRLGVV